jgi:hypothetical protein
MLVLVSVVGSGTEVATRRGGFNEEDCGCGVVAAGAAPGTSIGFTQPDATVDGPAVAAGTGATVAVAVAGGADGGTEESTLPLLEGRPRPGDALTGSISGCICVCICAASDFTPASSPACHPCQSNLATMKAPRGGIRSRHHLQVTGAICADV